MGLLSLPSSPSPPLLPFTISGFCVVGGWAQGLVCSQSNTTKLHSQTALHYLPGGQFSSANTDACVILLSKNKEMSLVMMVQFNLRTGDWGSWGGGRRWGEQRQADLQV